MFPTRLSRRGQHDDGPADRPRGCTSFGHKFDAAMAVARAVRAQLQEGHEVGFSAGAVDDSGELELTLHIDGHTGRCWLSREMWEAIGESAGWVSE